MNPVMGGMKMTSKKRIYQVTRAECQKSIKEGFVCEGCGGKVEPIKTVNNANEPTYWAACLQCNHYTHGIEETYFKVARKIVEGGFITPLRYMNKCDYENTPEKLAYYLAMQTSALSYDVRRIDKALSDYRGEGLE